MWQVEYFSQARCGPVGAAGLELSQILCLAGGSGHRWPGTEEDIVGSQEEMRDIASIMGTYWNVPRQECLLKIHKTPIKGKNEKYDSAIPEAAMVDGVCAKQVKP